MNSNDLRVRWVSGLMSVTERSTSPTLRWVLPPVDPTESSYVLSHDHTRAFSTLLPLSLPLSPRTCTECALASAYRPESHPRYSSRASSYTPYVRVGMLQVYWQHEQFSRKRVLGATISHKPTAASTIGRGSILDTKV